MYYLAEETNAPGLSPGPQNGAWVQTSHFTIITEFKIFNTFSLKIIFLYITNILLKYFLINNFSLKKMCSKIIKIRILTHSQLDWTDNMFATGIFYFTCNIVVINKLISNINS